MENKRDRQFTEEEIKDKIMRSAEDIEAVSYTHLTLPTN